MRCRCSLGRMGGREYMASSGLVLTTECIFRSGSGLFVSRFARSQGEEIREEEKKVGQ